MTLLQGDSFVLSRFLRKQEALPFDSKLDDQMQVRLGHHANNSRSRVRLLFSDLNR